MAPEYNSKCQSVFHLMFLPPCSTEPNPRENIWAWSRDCCVRDSTYIADKELSEDTQVFHARLQCTEQSREAWMPGCTLRRHDLTLGLLTHETVPDMAIAAISGL